MLYIFLKLHCETSQANLSVAKFLHLNSVLTFQCKTCLFSVATLVASNQTRDQMTEFWNKHSMAQSVEEMMLDSKAETLTQDEHPEVMGMLPCIKGKDVLELGAGIG